MENAALLPLQSGDLIILNTQVFSIGRALTNSFVIRELSVSRCHCVLEYTENGWTIQNKSVNKTFVNNQEVQNNYLLTNNDIVKLTYAASYKFIFPYDENTYMVSSNKKRKVENTNIIEQNKDLNIGPQNNSDAKRKTLLHVSQEASTSTVKRIDFLEGQLNHERHLKNQFKEENIKLELKLKEKEADVMDKLSDNIKLEQEVMDLKANCAALEGEKEELQLQLIDYECETTLLKCRLENLTELSVNQRENETKKDDSEMTDDESDNDIVQSVIKAEISQKELFIKEKLNLTINLIGTIRPVKPLKTNKPDILQTITTNLLELQSNVEELALKRNELQIRIKSNETLQNQVNVSNTEAFTQSKEEFIQVLQNQEEAISKMKEAFKADFLFKFYNSLELDLQCLICHELFIKSTCVDCGHIFCKKCITTWNRQKKSCPTCRKPIKTLLSCISLDSYIDQCYDLLFPDKKEIRDSLKQSYEDDASTSNANNVRAQIRAEPIVLSSDDDEDEDEDEDNSMTDFDSDFGDDELFFRRPRYGACFICGDPEHWANECPNRRRRH